VNLKEKMMKLTKKLNVNFHKINVYPADENIAVEVMASLMASDQKPLLVVPDLKFAIRVSKILKKMNLKCEVLGDHDVLPFESLEPSKQSVASRIKALESLASRKNAVVADVTAILKKTAPPDFFRDTLHFFKGREIKVDIAKWLARRGYKRTMTVRSVGEFARRGDIIDIFSPVTGAVRIEMFDNEIESIRLFNSENQLSVKKVNDAQIFPFLEFLADEESLELARERFTHSKHEEFVNVPFDALQGMGGVFWKHSHCGLDALSKNEYLIVFEPELCKKRYHDYEQEILELYGNDFKELYKKFSYVSFERLAHDKEIVISKKPLSVPFDDVIQITEKIKIPNAEERKKTSHTLQSFQIGELSDIKEGDLVVHSDHGIGIYEGTRIIKDADGEHEYLKIRYRHDAMLYVPIENFIVVNKYVGSNEKAVLSDINGKEWKKTKEKIRADIEAEINSMMHLYAEREESIGYAFEPDPELEKAFAKGFEHIETRDQTKAIEEVLSDMESVKPMDRLVCGDTGFGKTEVALRAAFRAIVNGKQVALLAPTTILARQHYNLFLSRMEPFGVKISLLTSQISLKEKKNLFEGISNGKVDVVIGTHALLTQNISFNDLGLIIVDEEQRFGTKQKDFLKKMKLNVDVLTLAATPIPRTLHMALSGIKKMSVIQTPPIGRVAPKVYVAKWNEKMIQGAILREINRGGQVFYVHNRVADLDVVTDKLKKLLPSLKIECAHGRMQKRDFLKVIDAFYEGKTDVLVATSVVENGVDVPNANTLIVDDVERYGLGQLYQLKGRVGRSNKRAFVYLTYFKEPSKEVMERLRALTKFSEPGSAMELALKDMEIRGVGEVFGFKQHGHIDSVGLYMYREILQQVISKVKDKKHENERKQINVELPSAILPKSYIPDSIERMKIYRKLASAKNTEEIDEIEREMKDRFGAIPSRAVKLLEHSKIRVLAFQSGMESVKAVGQDVELIFESMEALTNFKRFYKEGLTNPSKNVMILRGVIHNGDLQPLLKILLDYQKNMAIIKEGVS
jgi:transcription-repair coupling factor (superfamily II helicase)